MTRNKPKFNIGDQIKIKLSTYHKGKLFEGEGTFYITKVEMGTYDPNPYHSNKDAQKYLYTIASSLPPDYFEPNRYVEDITEADLIKKVLA